MYKIKRCLCVLVSVLFALLSIFCFKALYLSRFSEMEGERTFFLDTASSQGLQQKELSLMDVMRIKGECAEMDISIYAGGRYASSEEIAQEIAQKYHAVIMFQEEVCGVVSYYAYTAAWTDSVSLYGRTINLHIAVGAEKVTVGAPMIFGGY